MGLVALPRSNAPLKLRVLPSLASAFPPRAERHGLTTSGLLALLVWNDTQRPRSLEQVEGDARLVRSALTCSLRRGFHAMARRRARQEALSLNAYLEALIAAELARRGPLIIYPR